MPPTGSTGRRPVWRKAQCSAGNGECVEMAIADGMVLIRDTTEPGSAIFTCPRDEWDAFIDRVKGRRALNAIGDPRSTAGQWPSWARILQLGVLDKIMSYRPRERVSPKSVRDSLDRHISRYTEADDYQRRYNELLQETRATISSIIRWLVLPVMIVMLVCSLVWLAGITIAVVRYGLPPWVALGIGAGGPAAFILAAFRGVRHLKAGFDALSARWGAGPAADHGSREAAAR
jgi:hypothetical protein